MRRDSEGCRPRDAVRLGPGRPQMGVKEAGAATGPWASTLKGLAPWWNRGWGRGPWWGALSLSACQHHSSCDSHSIGIHSAGRQEPVALSRLQEEARLPRAVTSAQT